MQGSRLVPYRSGPRSEPSDRADILSYRGPASEIMQHSRAYIYRLLERKRSKYSVSHIKLLFSMLYDCLKSDPASLLVHGTPG
jgi:hypothetical protein